jgi:hypothetical protein
MLRRRRLRPGSAEHRSRREVGLVRVAFLLCLAMSAYLLAGASVGFPVSNGDDSAAIGPLSNLSVSSSPTAPSSAPTMSPSPSASPTSVASLEVTSSPVPAAVTPKPKVAPVAPVIVVHSNRLTIPVLGLDGNIGTTSCGGLIPNGIWLWPCAGQNNLYMLGHAWGSFAPIHNGYHAGLLKVGLVALYTDGAGVVHEYRLIWVQDLPVATWGEGTSWAATPGPVITLQTCDGAGDAYRIIVRFAPA